MWSQFVPDAGAASLEYALYGWMRWQEKIWTLLFILAISNSPQEHDCMQQPHRIVIIFERACIVGFIYTLKIDTPYFNYIRLFITLEEIILLLVLLRKKNEKYPYIFLVKFINT